MITMQINVHDLLIRCSVAKQAQRNKRCSVMNVSRMFLERNGRK